MEKKTDQSLLVLRNELNFLQYPYFALHSKGLKNRQRTEFRQTIKDGDGNRLEVYWLVNAHPDYGYPGPFDRKINMAVEYIVSQMPLPIKNPICLGSWYKFCRLMRVSPCGRNYRRIRQGFTRMTTTNIESRHTCYYKNKKRWINEVFHLYDHLVTVGEILDDSDEIADANYLYLNSWYIDNYNARYFKYLDYDYYNSLNPLASRLYQVLGLKFYGIKNLPAESRFLRYKYSTICMLLPATRQRHKSLAQRQLLSAHQQLLTTKFFSKAAWLPIPGARDDWYILYYPGERFCDELVRLNSQTASLPEIIPDQGEASHPLYPTGQVISQTPDSCPPEPHAMPTPPVDVPDCEHPCTSGHCSRNDVSDLKEALSDETQWASETVSPAARAGQASLEPEQADIETSPLAHLFFETVETYPELDIREKDLPWFQQRVETNPRYESIDLEDELYNWADWLEMEHRKKEQHKSNRFPKSNFKTSLTNWLKKAMEINQRINQKNDKGGSDGTYQGCYKEINRNETDIISNFPPNTRFLNRPPYEVQCLVENILDICKDKKSEGFYKKVARLMPEITIYRALAEVKEVRNLGEMKRNEGALFTSLIKKYAQEQEVNL